MTHNDLEKRIAKQAKKSIMSYAIYRPESALIIAMTIIFTALSAMNYAWFPIDWWIWPIFGSVAEALIVLSTLRDEKFHRHIFNEMFHLEFDIDKLHNKKLKNKLAKALEYRELIVEEIEREDDAVLDDYLMNMVHSLEAWIDQLYRLAQKLDNYWRDPIIARDMKTVPQELAQFNASLARTENPNTRRELEQTIAAKQAQWDTLRNLQETMTKAELHLEKTAATIGNIYTQVVLLGAKDVESPRAKRLQDDMVAQTYALEDVSTAMDEVYQMQA